MSTLALRLLTEVALRNRDRIDLVWTPVQNAFMVRSRCGRACAATLAHRSVCLCVAVWNACIAQRVMDTATEVNTRVEAAVTGVLRLAIRLLSRPTGSTNVLSSLAPLTRLPPAVAAHLRPHIAGGLAQVLSSAAANVSDHGGWGLIFTLLEQCADHRDASECVSPVCPMGCLGFVPSHQCTPRVSTCCPCVGAAGSRSTLFACSFATRNSVPVSRYRLRRRLLPSSAPPLVAPRDRLRRWSCCTHCMNGC